MRFWICTILIALLAFVFGLYLPWWTIALAAFILPMIIHQPPGLSFLSGFTGIFLLWVTLSWSVTTANDNILAPKIAKILPLGGSVYALILLAAFLGGLVGGLAALSSSLARKL